jgi:hypothetical protein
MKTRRHGMTERLTPEEKDHLETLARRAEHGPCTFKYVEHADGRRYWYVCGWDTDTIPPTEHNVKLWAAAHDGIPRLIAEVRALTEERDEARDNASTLEHAMADFAFSAGSASVEAQQGLRQQRDELANLIRMVALGGHLSATAAADVLEKLGLR